MSFARFHLLVDGNSHALGHIAPMSLPIREWSSEDRPQEKCLTQGSRALSTTECLALLIRSGAHGTSALQVAQKLWRAHGEDLQRLSSARPEAIMREVGVGPAKATALAAAFELGRRMRDAEEVVFRKRIIGSKEAFDILKPKLLNLDHEEFWVLFLSRAHQLMACECVGKGGWTGTLADLRVLFQRALELKSPNVVVGHNHPSGRLVPSAEDRELTQRLIQVGAFLDIEVLDHLIVGHRDYVSFADKGWMSSNPHRV